MSPVSTSQVTSSPVSLANTCVSTVRQRISEGTSQFPGKLGCSLASSSNSTSSYSSSFLLNNNPRENRRLPGPRESRFPEPLESRFLDDSSDDSRQIFVVDSLDSSDPLESSDLRDPFDLEESDSEDLSFDRSDLSCDL